MNIVKVFSNNAVSTVLNGNREAILIGSGIGFDKRPGDSIDESRISKIYYIQDELQENFIRLVQDISPSALESAQAIMDYAREQGLKLKDQLLLPLADHINFALDRQEQGIEMPYLILSETKMLYKKEFEIGQWALQKIQELCHVALPPEEIGYITMQLVSGSVDRKEAYDTLNFVSGALGIIKETYGVEIDPNQIDAMRLTTHLKFLAQRIFGQEQWADDDMNEFHSILLNMHSKNQECIRRLSQYIKETFHYQLSSQEEVYLLIHLSKIFN